MKINEYNICTNKKISDKTIASASDIHINKKTKRKQLQEILDTLQAIKPTQIVIPGDLYNVDYETVYSDDTKVIDFLNEAAEIAPVYYAPGNSELKSDLLPEGLTNNANPNLHILCDTSSEFLETGERRYQTIEMDNNDYINVASVKLPIDFYSLTEEQKYLHLEKMTSKLLKLALQCDEDKLNVLLFHDPYIIEFYKYLKGFDIVFSGHNHGGLFSEKLKPILKLLKADLKMLYPKYTKGLLEIGTTSFITSEGVTKYHTDMGALQHFEKFHEGTIDVVRCRKK